MASLFTRIVRGDISCYKIAESESCMAFLDIHPVARGHTLVVPKQEVDYLFEMEDEPLSLLMLFSKRVALAIQRVVPCSRIGVTVIGLEVPHAHIHLIPINAINDMNFTKPKLDFTNEEMQKLATEINAAFSLA